MKLVMVYAYTSVHIPKYMSRKHDVPPVGSSLTDQTSGQLPWIPSGSNHPGIAADTYNTSARVSFVTGEPILTLYSEYNKTRVTEISALNELIQSGDVRFFLVSSVMRYLDFELYSWIHANTREVSIQAGLPARDEMELLEIISR